MSDQHATAIPSFFRATFGNRRWSVVAAISLSGAAIVAGAVVTVGALDSESVTRSSGSDAAIESISSPTTPGTDEGLLSGDTPATTTVASDESTETDTDEDTAPVADGEVEAPADEQDEGPAPAADEIPPHPDGVYGAKAPEPMEPTPLEPVQAADPACEHLLPGRMVAAIPVVLLPLGEYDGEITVHNCSAGPVVAGLYSQYAEVGGAEEIPAFGQRNLGFQVDEDEFDAGAIAFTIDVKEQQSGLATPIQISAFKPSINDFAVAEADIGLSAGAHLTGCGGQCITTAWLSPRPNSANVGLELRSHTNAHYEVYLQSLNSAGGYVAISTEPWTESPSDQHREWTTTLSPLQPDTRYKIEVRAIDEDGHVSTRSTTFRTTDAVDQFAGNDPDPACSYQCITKAVANPTGSWDEVSIEIETHSPAEITVFYGTATVQWNGTTPSIPGAAKVTSPNAQTTSWTPTLDGLAGGTTYNMIVRAEDVYGHRSHQVGGVHTDEEPPRSIEVTFEKVILQYDGDKDHVFPNRGELSFHWGVDDLHWDSRSEHKQSGGNSFSLGGDPTILVAFDNETPRILTVNGGERDRAEKFCEALAPGPPRWRRPGEDCDGRKWNPAPDSFTLADVEELPYCAEFHMTGDKVVDHCAALTTPDRGGDYPRFTVYVRFHFLPIGD